MPHLMTYSEELLEHEAYSASISRRKYIWRCGRELHSTASLKITITRPLRIAILHLAPLPGDLAYNWRLVETAVTIPVRPLRHVGILICADAYSPWIARSLKAQGAQLLVSSAAWAPGQHGPNGEWEKCTRDTGLPLLVCNRTGPDRTLDFTEAESVVVKDGRRLLSFRSEHSVIFTVDWDLKTQNLSTYQYQWTEL